MASTIYISGTVIRGRKEARGLGFPTVNLRPSRAPKSLVQGIYATFTTTPVGVFKSVLYFGPRHGEGRARVLEVHCFGLTKSLYGKKVKVVFVKKIRSPRQFKTLAALKNAIKSDIKKAKQILQ